MERLEEQIKEYASMKDTLQETLLMAQRSAASKEEAAELKAKSTWRRPGSGRSSSLSRGLHRQR